MLATTGRRLQVFPTGLRFWVSSDNFNDDDFKFDDIYYAIGYDDMTWADCWCC